MPKLLFIYNNPHENRWLDGLNAALNILQSDFDITYHNTHDKPLKNEIVKGYDFVLGWGAFGSDVDNFLKKQDCKKGLCIAGNATLPEGADNYDVLFYETKWYRKEIEWHKNIIHAFGINTDIFAPATIPTPVVWDYIGVGAFAKWKRWEKMKDKPGTRLVIGYYQDKNEQESLEIVRDLVKNGVMVSNHVNPLDLVNYYYFARTVYVPSDTFGGGERTVLEARACGLNVEVEDDNPKLKELLECDIWDQHYYAKQLKKGINSCLKK